MPGTVCVRRLRRELLALKREPDETIRVATEDSLLVWDFVFRGVDDSPFAGGEYWGRVKFPETYPVQPPSVSFFTPNGRYETGKRLCLHGLSDYHGEDWNPKTTIKGLLQSIRHSMQDEGVGIGSLKESCSRRHEFTDQSRNYNRRHAQFRTAFDPGAGPAVPRPADVGRKEPVKAGAAGPTGNTPGMVVHSQWDVDRIMRAASNGDIEALAGEVRRAPHAVHALRRDGKTPAVIAALGKHVAAFIFLVERGAAFKHHGSEPGFNGHHVSSLLGCETDLNRLAELALTATAVFHERRAIIERIHRKLLGTQDLGKDLRGIIADAGFPRGCDAPARPLLPLVQSSGEPVVRVAYLMAEMPLCTLQQKLQRLRIIIDVMLTANEEIMAFIDLNGMLFLDDLVGECHDHAELLTKSVAVAVVDEGTLGQGLYIITRIILFVCMYAAGEKRNGNPTRRTLCIGQGVCQTVIRTLLCRLTLDTAGVLNMPGFLPAAPAAKTVAFACQSLTELSFDADTAVLFDPLECKMLAEALCDSYVRDVGCAEMLSWWTSNMIGHKVFSKLPGKATWAAKIADQMLQCNHTLERANILIDLAVNNSGSVNILRAACNGNTKLLLEEIASDPAGIHRPDNKTGRMPLMATANAGNKSVCDALIVLIERGGALKHHAPLPKRGRHHVDKFVQHADIVEGLANLAEMGYDKDGDDAAAKRTCPGGHALEPFVTVAGKHRCDSCEKTVPLGFTLFDCKHGCECGWNECQKCHNLYTSSVEHRLQVREQLVDQFRALYPPPPLSAKAHQALLVSCMGCDRTPAAACHDDTCFMCNELFAEIPPADIITLADDCGHQHHLPCLGEWLMGNRGSCPTCDRAVSVAWPAPPAPPTSPMSVTAAAIAALEDGIKSSGRAAQLAAILGARILADQALSSSRRARTVAGSVATPLVLATIRVHRHAPEVLFNVALAVLEVATSLKPFINVGTIGRHYLPIINALLEACIAHTSQTSSPGAIWPVVAEMACQTAAELSLEVGPQSCGPVTEEYGNHFLAPQNLV